MCVIDYLNVLNQYLDHGQSELFVCIYTDTFTSQEKIRCVAAFSWVESLHVHVATKMNFLLIDITSCILTKGFETRSILVFVSYDALHVHIHVYPLHPGLNQCMH